MDGITRAISEAGGIRVALVDVTETTRELVRRHRSDEVTTTLLGQALVGAALLSVHLKADDEAISLHLRTDGPINSVMTEVWGQGVLRGYARRSEDGATPLEAKGALGSHGTMTVLHSTPESLLYSGTVNATPPDVQRALARYFNHSQQTPAGVRLFARAGAALSATGLVVEKLPGGDTEAFVGALEALDTPAVLALLDGSAPLDELAARIGLSDLRVLEVRPLRFGCRCSEERVLVALASLPQSDIAEILVAKGPQEVTCQFCGQVYAIPASRLAETLLSNAKEN